MTTTVARNTSTTEQLKERAANALARCGADPDRLPGQRRMVVRSPITGEMIAEVPMAAASDVEQAITTAHAVFKTWRSVPAPVRGAPVKRLGQLLTEHKSDLADLIGVEVGKIRSEALGEVQEVIDICDFAVGVSLGSGSDAEWEPGAAVERETTS